MELYALDRSFERETVIDVFESLIWTERYYGDSEIELIVPRTSKQIPRLTKGTFLGLAGSKEIMSIETIDINELTVTFNGIGLLPWFNNRFIRVSNVHNERVWYFEPQPPGQILWVMISDMCTQDSTYLKGEIPIDIPLSYLERLVIPELGLHAYDTSGDPVPMTVPFGKLYAAMREIATTYSVGMQIVREPAEAEYPLGFRSYRGLDRTSEQSVNPIVRFSPYLESLTNVKELQSVADHKNLVFTFASEVDDSLDGSGVAYLAGSEEASGFDLRASQEFVEVNADIPDDEVVTFLHSQARNILDDRRIINVVDGEIVPTHMFQYGRDYNLGDIVEIQGYSGVIFKARVLEHIQAQDSTGTVVSETL